jgi:predicted transcriptional regulator
MQQLTNAEEQVMEHLLKLEKAFMKDLLEAYQNQTCNHNHRYFIKRMIDKHWPTLNLGTLEYYPLVKKPIISRNTSTD